jgi:RNA polymerase sigma factor (sigma-70 family)
MAIDMAAPETSLLRPDVLLSSEGGAGRPGEDAHADSPVEWHSNDDRVIGFDILRRVAGGDVATWSSMLGKYGPRLTALGRAHGLCRQDVEDALQRTWLSLFTYADRIRDPRCVGGWLATTMRRESLTVLKARREEPMGDWTAHESGASSDEGPEERLESLERASLAKELWDLVEELPTRQRELLRVMFGDGEPSYAEVSARTGLPLGAIGPTRQRALRRLRALFEESQRPVAA